MAALAVHSAREGTNRALWPAVLVGAMVIAFVAALLVREPGATRALYVGLGVMALAWIAFHDFRTHRAPNQVVYPVLALALFGSVVLGWQAALSSLAGAVVAFVVFFVIAALGRGKMGYGDVKVAAIAGALVGIKTVLSLLLVTYLVAALVAAIALGFRLRGRRDTVAFTPFLLFGVVACAWFVPTLGPS
jgi:leader peptidase (prepilin peptidase) / N-methyltransferase